MTAAFKGKWQLSPKVAKKVELSCVFGQTILKMEERGKLLYKVIATEKKNNKQHCRKKEIDRRKYRQTRLNIEKLLY